MKKFVVLLNLLAFSWISVCNGTARTFEGMATNRREMIKEFPSRQSLAKTFWSIYDHPDVRRLFSDSSMIKALMAQAQISPNCQSAVSFAISNIGSDWSFTMIDALAKPPFSIQKGSIHWLGGYRPCMDNKPSANYNGSGNSPRSHYCRGNFRSSAIPLPRDASIDIGLCIPETCTAEDVTNFFTQAGETIKMVTNQTLLSIVPSLSFCYTRKEELNLSDRAKAMIAVCAIFCAALLIGTIYDFFVRLRRGYDGISKYIAKPKRKTARTGFHGTLHATEFDNNSSTTNLHLKDISNVSTGDSAALHEPELERWERVLMSFSLYSNAVKIMDATPTPNRLGCLDGIRFLSMSWVILGHTYFFIGAYANNAVDFSLKIAKRWTYQAIVNAYFSVDSFFVLSGLLTGYIFLKEAKKLGTLKNVKFWILYFVHRYWRLTPPYMLFIGFYTSLFTYLTEGPMFNQYSGIDSQFCEKNWWTNILYVNNVVRDREMCMGWTWYLANDMQFHFLIAPFMLPLIFVFGKWGALSALPVIVAATVTTGVISKQKGFIGTGIEQDFFNTLYIKPWCRVQAYVFGILTAFLYLEHQKRKWKLHKAVVFLGWCVATAACLGPLYGLAGYMDGSYEISVEATAAYNALSRTAWSVGLGWLIYACLTGHGGWINEFLSWKAFIPLSRLTYCAFLVHPVVQIAFYQGLHYSPIVNTLTMVVFFLGHMAASYGVAFILSLTVEAPMIGMEKVVLRKK